MSPVQITNNITTPSFLFLFLEWPLFYLVNYYKVTNQILVYKYIPYTLHYSSKDKN